MAYAQYTLAQLQQKLALRTESVPFWVPAEATLALNEGLRTWNLLTGRWGTRVTLQTDPNAYDYGLPASLLYRTRVLWDDQPMSPSSREDFENGRPNWRRETTGSGGAVPTQPTLWAPVSLQLIWIWPADAAGHHALTLDGVAATPVLVGAGDFVDLGEDDLSILLGFALHVLTFKKGGPWFRATLPLFRAFLAAAAQENRLITTSQTYRRFMGLDTRDLKPLRPTSAPSTLGRVIAGESTAGEG